MTAFKPVSLLVVAALLGFVFWPRRDGPTSGPDPVTPVSPRLDATVDRLPAASRVDLHQPASPAESKVPAAVAVDLPEAIEPGRAAISVVVTGLQPEQGAVRVALFDRIEAFPDHHQAETTKAVSAGSASQVEIRFEGLAAGSYAIAAYQDLDENGELNRAPLGYPTEPYGFSRAARGRFGPPAFSQAALEVSGEDQVVEIELR